MSDLPRWSAHSPEAIFSAISASAVSASGTRSSASARHISASPSGFDRPNSSRKLSITPCAPRLRPRLEDDVPRCRSYRATLRRIQRRMRQKLRDTPRPRPRIFPASSASGEASGRTLDVLPCDMTLRRRGTRIGTSPYCDLTMDVAGSAPLSNAGKVRQNRLARNIAPHAHHARNRRLGPAGQRRRAHDEARHRRMRRDGPRVGHRLARTASRPFRCRPTPRSASPSAPRRIIEERFLEFEPDAVHIATEGPLGWAARAVCLKHKFPYTTSYHTRFPEYIAARFWFLPIWMGYMYVREFHKYSGRVMVATPSMRDELESQGLQEHRALVARRRHRPFPSGKRRDDRGPFKA